MTYVTMNIPVARHEASAMKPHEMEFFFLLCPAGLRRMQKISDLAPHQR